MTSEYDSDSTDSRNLQSWRVPNEVISHARIISNNIGSELNTPKNNSLNINKKIESNTTSIPSIINKKVNNSISIEVESNPNTSYIPKNSNNLDMRKQYWSLLWVQFNQYFINFINI